jgi:riboflavin kinase/FMN adenylyltransferase
VPGRGLGRKLGTPTANLNPHNEVAPPDGVYIVRARWDGIAYSGIVNLGVRPTVTRLRLWKNVERVLTSDLRHPVSGVYRPSSILELHIFGLRRNLYGKVIEVTFLKKLRGERAFPSLEALQRQIRKDIERAKSWFGHN